MSENIVGKLRCRLKARVLDFLFKVMMLPARWSTGRRLFGHEEFRLLHEALLSQNLFGVGGKMVPAFEAEFAKAYGVPYAVASTSGTAAIHTALGALDLNPGDEIITAPITDLGTIIPILYQLCVPVFADINETYNMDPADIERKITPKTKAIIVVHLFGNPCDMDPIVRIAKERNIALIEDCAQAHMTEYKGKYVGTFGDIGCFSFQQAKHMTTGDGGMTVTFNKAYAERMKLFVDKGYARKGWGSRAYLFLAPNYRMNELTAAVGLAQLKKVKAVVETRNQLGTYLTQLLAGIPGVEPVPVTPGARSSYWLYPARLKAGDVDTLAKHMIQQGAWVSAGYIGKPIYLCSESLAAKKTFGDSKFPFSPQVTDKHYEYKEGLCPKAEEALKHLIGIPLDESWDKARIEKTVATLKACLQDVPAGAASAQPVRAKAETRAATPGDAKKVRIAIVGCGQMGRWHLDAYKQDPRVELAAFADTDLSKAEQLAKAAKSGVRAYASHAELIKNERLDGASVCTVPSTHRDIVCDLLEAGVHVLCEKPLAASVGEAEAMLRKADEKQKLLLTAFKFRFFEEVLKAKELLEKGSLGRVLTFRLMFGGHMEMAGSWYARKELSGGGIVMDNGPHAFDLIRYLLGEIESVSADLRAVQRLEVEDTAHISCVLKSGASGSVDLSWSNPASAKTYLEIYGEDGALLLDAKGLNCKFKTWDEWKRVAHEITSAGAFARQIVHFVDAIHGVAPRVVASADGLKAQILIEQCYRSAAPAQSVLGRGRDA